MAKRKTEQMAFRVSQEVAEETRAIAERLGLDLSNFLRTVLMENLATYRRRAEQIDRRGEREDCP